MPAAKLSEVTTATRDSAEGIEARPFTKFPSLFQQRDASVDIIEHRVLAGTSLPPEILTLAWASVLGGYSGIEDV